MAKKHHDFVPDPIIDAALSLAAESGWRGLSLAEIAERAQVPLAELVEHFPSRAAILDAFSQRVDRRMLEGGTEPGEHTRDRLFDVIMRRFDAMAEHRQALSVILRQSTDDPWALLCGGRRFVKSMALVLETAGLSAAGLDGLARIKGVSLVYLYAFKSFLDDDSADHSRTMAALDKALRRAERLWTMLSWRRAPASPSATPDLRHGNP